MASNDTEMSNTVSNNNRDARLKAAFGLVEDKTDWKESVDAILVSSDLARAGVTLEDVVEAIRFYTATEPTVITCEVAALHRAGLVPLLFPGFHITAEGYRRGPAGDH